MMWYSELKNLDYNRPIFSVRKSKDKRKELLLPQIGHGSYDIIGYNWFDLSDGEYSSCAVFSTVEAALKSRDGYCTFVNGIIEVDTK